MGQTVLAAALALAPISAVAGSIGYAQATGYYKKDSRPTLYQPLNLLDAREATAWCSTTSDPLNEQLTFGFKGPSRIDEIRVYTGNGFGEDTWEEFSRARKFSLKGPTGAQVFTVADQRGFQPVAINPPLEGSQFTMEVLDQYPAADLDMPVCVTDIVFYSDGKPLNGSWLTQKLKFNKQQAPYLGTWFAGYEGAPDRFLSFFFDGTFRFAYEPLDQGQQKGRAFSGDYEISGSRISLELPGKGKVTARIRRDRLKGKPGHSLVLEGELPEDLRQTFRDSI
ncbi:MAG: hypothetical protein HYZ28_03785 [Myxococcales bacterium]|nr:hypothetical protein [Myxococcales bacterium]